MIRQVIASCIDTQLPNYNAYSTGIRIFVRCLTAVLVMLVPLSFNYLIVSPKKTNGSALISWALRVLRAMMISKILKLILLRLSLHSPIFSLTPTTQFSAMPQKPTKYPQTYTIKSSQYPYS